MLRHSASASFRALLLLLASLLVGGPLLAQNKTISAAGLHSLFLGFDCTDPTLPLATGYNGTGQLGDGTSTNRNSPVQVAGLTGVKAVAAGLYHTLFLQEDGTVWATGYNAFGQLGDGTNTPRNSPVQVLGLTGVKAVAAGEYHSLFLQEDGTAWATGYNDYGQLGDGTLISRNSPIAVQFGTCGVVPQISCPANISVGNDAGQCGAVVSFTATEMTGSPSSTITYSTASGSYFPIGTTTVTATATNASGSSQCSFTVMVSDTQPPVIICPATINATATSFDGATVTYTAPVGTDNCPGAVTTRTAGPASGSTFPLGTTTVTYQVRDAAGNTTPCSFQVSVKLPSCGNTNHNVQICYYGVTQCVSESVAKRYIKLGATLGPCNAANTRTGYELETTSLPLTLSLKAYPNPRRCCNGGSTKPGSGSGHFRGAGRDGPGVAIAPAQPGRRLEPGGVPAGQPAHGQLPNPGHRRAGPAGHRAGEQAMTVW